MTRGGKVSGFLRNKNETKQIRKIMARRLNIVGLSFTRCGAFVQQGLVRIAKNFSDLDRHENVGLLFLFEL